MPDLQQLLIESEAIAKPDQEAVDMAVDEEVKDPVADDAIVDEDYGDMTLIEEQKVSPAVENEEDADFSNPKHPEDNAPI